MKRILNNYLAFTSLFYRILMFLVYPLAMIGLYEFFLTVGRPAFLMLVIAMMVFIEIWSDYWIFGGIASKDMKMLDYVKTSNKGMNFVQRAFICDLLRRILIILVVLMACYLLSYQKFLSLNEKVVWNSIMLSLLSYIFMVVGTTITRFFDFTWINLTVGYLAMFVVLVLPLIMKENMVTIILLIGLSLIVSVGQIRLMMNRVRRGYYDGKDKAWI